MTGILWYTDQDSGVCDLSKTNKHFKAEIVMPVVLLWTWNITPDLYRRYLSCFHTEFYCSSAYGTIESGIEEQHSLIIHYERFS